jgi:hypothetical protein
VAVPTPSAAERYRERLAVPLRWWLGALAAAAVAAAEVHGGADGWRSVVPYAVLLPGTLLVLALLSRPEVRVEERVLHVPGARAPLTAFGEPEVLDRQALRRWLGPQGDPGAHVRVRPWHRGAVRLPVVDPDDDTPYWLVGSREPAALAAALA